MKFNTGSFLRSCFATVACTIVAGCGGEASNPSAVTVENLKNPNTLKVLDNGDGAVTLSWYGANFEENFEGYNVYGMKLSDTDLTTLGLVKGKPVELLDEKGNAIEATKTALTKFNYSPTTGLESAAEAPVDSEKDTRKISFLPIHTLNAKSEPILPTCQPSASNGGTCTATTEAGKKTSGVSVNGLNSYSITGLKPGSQYCFLIMSALNSGKEISQTSTNMECVTPKYKLETTLTAAGGVSTPYNLRDYIKSCVASTTGKCPTLTAGTVGSSATSASTSSPFYVEAYSTANTVYFVSGKNAAIQDLGYYASGFSDATLPKEAPKLNYTFAQSSNVTNNEGGYAIPGQSIILRKNHMYVVAVGADASASSPTSFNYHWIWLKDSTADPSKAAAFNVEMRLAPNVDNR